jgi:hypothetical protein
MIAFDKDKIRVYKMSQQIHPIIEIRGNDQLRVLVHDNKTIGRTERIMWHFKRPKRQVPNSEISIVKWLELERVESVSIETLIFQLLQTAFMDPHLNALILKNSQRIIADVIAMYVRNNKCIDIMQIAQMVPKQFPRSFHRTQAAIYEYPGVIGPEQKAIATAAAP